MTKSVMTWGLDRTYRMKPEADRRERQGGHPAPDEDLLPQPLGGAGT
jgi:hypothetical protein